MFSQDYNSIPLFLGVSGNGITVYSGELPDVVQLNNFPWYVTMATYIRDCFFIHNLFVQIFVVMLQFISLNIYWFDRVRVSAIKYKNKNLILDMVPSHDQEYDESIIFQIHSRTACKELWKSCVEHHAFFRSLRSDRRASSTNFLFRRGSTFRYRLGH